MHCGPQPQPHRTAGRASCMRDQCHHTVRVRATPSRQHNRLGPMAFLAEERSFQTDKNECCMREGGTDGLTGVFRPSQQQPSTHVGGLRCLSLARVDPFLSIKYCARVWNLSGLFRRQPGVVSPGCLPLSSRTQATARTRMSHQAAQSSRPHGVLQLEEGQFQHKMLRESHVKFTS